MKRHLVAGDAAVMLVLLPDLPNIQEIARLRKSSVSVFTEGFQFYNEAQLDHSLTTHVKFHFFIHF